MSAALTTAGGDQGAPSLSTTLLLAIRMTSTSYVWSVCLFLCVQRLFPAPRAPSSPSCGGWGQNSNVLRGYSEPLSAFFRTDLVKQERHYAQLKATV